MPNGPIRRSQLIAPFGVGAMTVGRDGVSLICAGLDHWFEREEGSGDIDLEEFKIFEWRLQSLLRVNHFRLPPDYRRNRGRERTPNAWLTQPFLRFPQWHFCSSCSRLFPMPSTARGRLRCTHCQARGRPRPLFQVPFVAMCDRGHLQDFPWREWTHREENPSCAMTMRLVATGGASLAAQRIECECGRQRTLANIVTAFPDGNTFLSNNLLSDDPEDNQNYLCRGLKPWLGEKETAICDRPLRGSLRSASNLYFALVSSSIYLPRSSDEAPSSIVTLMEKPPLSTLISLLVGADIEVRPEHLRAQQPQLLQAFPDEQVQAALNVIRGNQSTTADITDPSIEGEDSDTSFRRAEFNVLRSPREDKQLLIKDVDIGEYKEDVSLYFSKIMLVNKLRETRAFSGFTRVFPENGDSLEDRKEFLRRNPTEVGNDWLPAYVVYGEGIFIELDDSRLRAWERRNDVMSRTKTLADQYQRVRQARNLRERTIDPRFVLLHTLSHLIMNRLTFECGYSSAALRERLYYSDHPEYPMGSILIYTAAGDAEGTMGGLVRMGKPSYLEPVIRRSLEDAYWCSADPVCRESALLGGQGPDSCNLSACHNCALVPETACEEFNRFLDRGLVIGEPDNRQLGYFGSLAS